MIVGTIKHVTLVKSRGEVKSITLFYGSDDIQVIRAQMLLAAAAIEHNLSIAFEFDYFFACNLVFKIALFMQLLSNLD